MTITFITILVQDFGLKLQIEFKADDSFPMKSFSFSAFLWLDLSSLLILRIARLGGEQEKKERQIKEIKREEKGKWKWKLSKS